MWSWPARITNGWPGCEPYLLAALPKLKNPASVGWPKRPFVGRLLSGEKSDAHLLGSRLSQGPGIRRFPGYDKVADVAVISVKHDE